LILFVIIYINVEKNNGYFAVLTKKAIYSQKYDHCFIKTPNTLTANWEKPQKKLPRWIIPQES